MVSPDEWGPKAWELLHSIAERLGNNTHISMIRDEQTELRLTLRHFYALLPCHRCQKHYREWVQQHPPNTTRYGEYLQDDIREWLYNLHENVNKQRDITSGIQLESVKDMYNGKNPRTTALYMRSVYQRGLQSGMLKPEEWKSAWKHLDMLLRTIGV